MAGILHLGGPSRAELNLILQAALAVAMTVGVICVRRTYYRAHGRIQASVVTLNLVVIGALMLPYFPRNLLRKAPSVFTRPYIAVVAVHALFGAAAELLGLYVVLSAGTRLLPQRFRLRNYRLWMRATFMLWWVSILTGATVYYVWYLAPAG
ncbi:MAG: DUF420 domain-containing protein [Terriglobia bacterium]